MTDNIKYSRRSILAGATLLTAVTALLVLGVIPPVRSDSFPLATPQRAAAAFWAHAGLALLAAVVLLSLSAWATVRTRLSTTVLGALAVLVLLLGAALSGAALTLRDHGPAMQGTVILLFLCTAAEFLTAALLIAAAILLAKRA